MIGMVLVPVRGGADVKTLFVLACAGVVVAACWALWIGKDDMRRYRELQKM
jgi:hypothetical protein